MDRPDRPMMDAEVDLQHDVLPSSTRIKLLYYVLRQMIYANRPVDTKACDYLVDAHRPGSRVDTCHNLFDVDFIRYAILEGLAIVLADDLDMKDEADEIISRSKAPRMEETSTKRSSKRAAKKAAKKPTQKPAKASTGATQCPEMLGLPVILACTTALYMSRMTLPERTFDHVMRTCKLLVKTTAERKEVRYGVHLFGDLFTCANGD